MRHLLRGLLRWLIPVEDRASLLGDLEEEYAQRVRPARGRLSAGAWYAWELVSAAAHGVFGRRRGTEGLEAVRRRHRRRVFLFADIRYAFRRWRRRPGFVATAVLTLALGIGATTSIFSVVDAVLLAPAPWPEADRLVRIHTVSAERRLDPARAAMWDRGELSWPAWDALRESPAFDSVGMWMSSTQPMTYGEGRTELVPVLRASSNLIPLLGVRILHGRNFTSDDDDVPHDSVILTQETWQRRFGGRPDVVGESVVLGVPSSSVERLYEIVGVAGPGLQIAGKRPEVVLPVGVSAQNARAYPSQSLRVVARLAPGVSLGAAAEAADAIVRAVENREPTTARVVPMVEDELGDSARVLWLLMGAATVLLLVACANVGGLILGEGCARRQEIAIRLALGGSRLRVSRQLVVEHLLLAAAGTVGSLVVAIWLTRLFIRLAPGGLPGLDAVSVDPRVALFAAVLGGSTLLIVGIGPAVLLSRTPVAPVIAQGGRDNPGRQVGHRALVGTQVALALVLIVGATLFGETVYRLTSRPLGFDPAHLAVISTTFTGSRAGSYVDLRPARDRGEDVRALFAQLQVTTMAQLTARVADALSALPGVVAVGGATSPPLFGGIGYRDIRLEGGAADDLIPAQRKSVTDSYFRTMNMPVLIGRGFEPADQPGARVAVVSREFERRYLTGFRPGQRFFDSEVPFEIVGVVPNVKQVGFTDDELATYYVLDRQSGFAPFIVVRTEDDPTSMLPSMRKIIAEVDPQLVVTATTTMEETLAEALAAERLRASLSALFGGTALILSAVGLYGLAARRVADRRRELGVRVALGARPSNLRRLVLRDAVVNVGVGLAFGLPAAFAASKLTAAYLFGVSPTAPHVFGLAAVVLALAAAAATLLPARRASRIDPVLVLKD